MARKPTVVPATPSSASKAGAGGLAAPGGVQGAVVISLPLPPVQLHPNVPTGWRAKSPHAKRARRDAMLAAYNERPGVPFMACEARATFSFRMPRRRDGDNLMAWLKHSIDGLTDAAIWVDDSVVTWLAPVVIVDHKGEAGVTITVWPVESEGVSG